MSLCYELLNPIACIQVFVEKIPHILAIPAFLTAELTAFTAVCMLFSSWVRSPVADGTLRCSARTKRVSVMQSESKDWPLDVIFSLWLFFYAVYSLICSRGQKFLSERQWDVLSSWRPTTRDYFTAPLSRTVLNTAQHVVHSVTTYIWDSNLSLALSYRWNY